jgi:hypothetical protein
MKRPLNDSANLLHRPVESKAESPEMTVGHDRRQSLPSGHSGPFSLVSTLNFSRVYELHSNQARPMGQGELGVDLPSGYPDESYPGFAAPVS